MRPELHPGAVQDFYDQLGYLERQQCGLLTLGKFVQAIQEGRDKIGRHPLTWSFVRGSTRVRKLPVRTFRYVIYYIVQPNGVPLILELAGPGRLARWKKRL